MKKTWMFIAIALVVSLALAALVSPFASGSPDGLEKVAEDQGFLSREAEEPAWKHALMPDYWSEDEQGETPVRKAIAGIVGTLVVFAVGFGIAKVLARKPAKPDAAH